MRKEKDSAVRACGSAYEAGELLKEQLALLKSEKEAAESQVRDCSEYLCINLYGRPNVNILLDWCVCKKS